MVDEFQESRVVKQPKRSSDPSLISIVLESQAY